MSLIATHSDSQLSSDPSRLINHFRDPLKVKKDAKIGLTSLSFSKSPNYLVTTGVNDTFYIRICYEAPDEFGTQFKIVLESGEYDGDELASHITSQVNKFVPLSNFIWLASYDKEKKQFDLACVQGNDSTNLLTLESAIEPSSGANSFANNGTGSVTFTTSSYTTSTSFTNRVTDQMCYTSYLQPDGTNSGTGNQDPESGGILRLQIPGQKDNGGSTIGLGTYVLSLVPYWQRFGAANQRPVIGNTKSLVSFRVRDNGTFNGIELDLDILKPSTSISPPTAGWEGSLKNIFTGIDPATNMNTLPSIGGTAINNWTTYNYNTDHVYAQLELERMSQVSVWIWHDNAGDLSEQEKQKIYISTQADFEFVIRAIDYPLSGGVQQNSGNVDTPNSSIVSGTFVDISFGETGKTTVSASEISTALDPAEILAGDQGSLEVSFMTKFGKAPTTAPNVDKNPSDANADDLLGFAQYETDENITIFGQESIKEPEQALVRPDVHVELSDYNIKSLRGRRSDIGKIVCVLPAEELSSNLSNGVIHYSTSSPIMLSMNLEHDISISNMTVNLRSSDGKLLEKLTGNSTATFLVE